MHRRLPSFSLTSSFSEKEEDTSASSITTTKERTRSRSPFRRATGYHPRDPSAEGVRREDGDGDESEADMSSVRPANNFDSESEEESETDEEDEQLERNTEANASGQPRRNFITPDSIFPGEGANIQSATDFPPTATVSTALTRNLRRRASTKSRINLPLALVPGRPVFEKNRCTISLTLGDPDLLKQGRRTRSYIVASDLSLESRYALEWGIGTVLRDGDECLIVSVMETDSKFDVDDASASSAEKKAKLVNQRERQANALMLLRQATALLERTRLNVRIECQAVHAKNARHMLVDMIDYLEPTMVIIGTRGLSKIKGMLLGSVSNYLIQKSSAPVMVTRRPLRLARTVHKKLSSLNREVRRSLADAETEKISHGGAVLDDKDEPSNVAQRVEAMKISEK